jgi:3-deoxy-D-manno-octulosonate 8-phosphate phosphatase (KDO 8-P phosphatase)
MIDYTQIKVLVIDCDGVLTDGLIIYDSMGREIKNFSAHDGMGFMILKHTDIIPIIITGRKSTALDQRCADLNIKHNYQLVKNKRKKLTELLSQLNLDFSNVAYIGDDWNDFLAMKDCQLKIAPKNARRNFQITVDYVTEYPGGYGAVRDAIEHILINRNEFEGAIEKLFAEWESSE